MITKEDVVSIQKKWSDGLLEIVNQHQNNLDFTSCASEFIDRLYDYQNTEVLFKPTLAKEIQFRNSKDAALSYFIGNNSNFPEDNGFALKGWSNVKWENSGIQLFENIAIAMGNYYFTNNEGTIKVEFSFVYKKDNNGDLRIILHDSHLPYQG
ncbi:phosphoribosyl-AMP cyclohydrolase [bacterium]|nr:phosphoribosyl-AMP cyclohydrolase [bacterium]